MTYVPRSPRRATTLRAVVDAVNLHAVGAVRDMSTSGMFVEAAANLSVGCRVAVVPLIGELDGERIPAEVARVVDRGVALRFIGLDAEVRQRLRRTFSGDESPLRIVATTQRPPLATVPSDAPVFLLTDEPAAVERPAQLSGDALTTMRGTIERLESQLMEVSRKQHVVSDENNRLKRETMAQQARLSVALALRMRVDDDLSEARAVIEDLERVEDTMLRRIQALERLLQMALIAPDVAVA